MKKYPRMRIEITGHTSSEGDRYDNIELSRKRAEACKEYLKKKGVEGGRVFTKGVGPDSPISTTDKSLNRRVEFVVLKVN
jgi:outer membrane protein OmpA-like peptidoglycan-associated protein